MHQNPTKSFRELLRKSPSFLAKAPGRVNLLGEHVDYNHGPVLPMAINMSMDIASAPSGNPSFTIHALDLNETVKFQIKDLDKKIDVEGRLLPDWALYPAGAAWSLNSAGFAPEPIEAVFTSSIPIGAGLSSSAALEVGFATLWKEIGRWDLSDLEIAQFCQKAENEYVGLSCGLMDQFSSACGVEGHALYFDTDSLFWEPKPLPPGTSIVVADSTVRHNLTNSAYNQRRASCEEAVRLLREYKPGLKSLRDIQTPEFMALSLYLPTETSRRAEHVVKEIARVESAYHALQRGDADAFGALMYSGHASLRDLYEVSTPELDSLVELARNGPGCYGARLTGAGFGGCTINLVAVECLADFMKYLKTQFKALTGLTSDLYPVTASIGARAWDL